MKKKNDPDTGAVEYLWMKLDEAKLKNPRLMVILTANDISKMPDTVLNRFAGEIHKITLPNAERRLQMITLFLKTQGQENIDLAKNVSTLCSALSVREVNLALCKARGKARIRCDKEKSNFSITHDEIIECLQPVLDQHNELVWVARKKAALKNLKKSAPYLIQTALFFGGCYFGWKLYKLQAQQAQQIQDQNVDLQLKLHAENELLADYNHLEALKQAEKLHLDSFKQQAASHQASLAQAKELHQDAHSWTKAGKAILTSAGGAATGALAIYVAPIAKEYAKAGVSALIKIITGNG